MKNIFLYTLVLLGFYLILSNVSVSQETIIVKDSFYLTPQQEAYLGTLRFCESRGRENFKILDSNNKYSFAPYMFQMDTFLSQGKLYGVLDKNLTAKEAESSRIIYNRDIQEKIAHYMLLDGKQKNWLNCWNTKLNHEVYPR